MQNLIQFEAGQSYQVRFIGDSELIVPMEVIKRTAKSVWIKVRNEEVIRKTVKVYNGSEYVLPMGSYSMAPSARAEKKM